MKREKTIKKRPIIFVVVSVILVVALSLTMYSWFYYSRRAAAMAEIANPMSLYINSGQEEDIMYMDLSGIDLTEGEYKDFVFCIRGTTVAQYAIQLAYTTNNQFTYELYPATETSGSVPANSLGSVEYLSHTVPSVKMSYYIANGLSPLPGDYKNKIDAQILAKNDDEYFTFTYDEYTTVNQYARPIYWQTKGIIHTSGETGSMYNGRFVYNGSNVGDFSDYYILRICWTEGRQNDKETDIIYISAKTMV